MHFSMDYYNVFDFFLQLARERHAERRKQWQYESDRTAFLAQQEVQNSTSNDNSWDAGGTEIDQNIALYATEREARVQRFIEHVRSRHRQFLEQACPDF